MGGVNYLGLGFLLLILIVSYKLAHERKVFGTRTHVPLLLAAVVLLIISLSNRVTFADFVLFEYTLS